MIDIASDWASVYSEHLIELLLIAASVMKSPGSALLEVAVSVLRWIHVHQHGVVNASVS